MSPSLDYLGAVLEARVDHFLTTGALSPSTRTPAATFVAEPHEEKHP
ncbi:hypothetical protein [Nocardioides sp. GXQ0305]